ncbi:hypothetical protein [Hoeflea alexandrii]|uniref:hypothetical protein n=1 Tax=Hoeflea alexandrii TaxID=288436 RepID=UPI0022AEB96B|nr:hypothetical protein [Hoeflea alexandrii]MCZ4287791.1 hypothetical protein [Hoeflea alexandrii]
MISSRLYYASMMLFWVCYLSLLALVVTYAPQDGVSLAGLTLFADAGLVDSATAAMRAIGLSPLAQSVVFGLLGGFSAASAGLLLFAMVFYVFGEEREQREARPLAQGAVACTAAASMLTTLVFFAGGQAGTLLALEFGALGGLFLTIMSLSQSRIEPDGVGDEGIGELDRVIADHAANHAAFSAQLASISRQGTRS